MLFYAQAACRTQHIRPQRNVYIRLLLVLGTYLYLEEKGGGVEFWVYFRTFTFILFHLATRFCYSLSGSSGQKE